jgi:Tfp pilus assembly protein PilE
MKRYTKTREFTLIELWILAAGSAIIGVLAAMATEAKKRNRKAKQ